MLNWKELLFVFVVCLAIMYLFFWIGNKFIAPWQLRRQLTRQPFCGLLVVGFSPAHMGSSWHVTDEPGTTIALVGEVAEYTVEISSNYTIGWNKFPFYLIRVFFSTENLSTQALHTRHQKNVEQSKLIRWDDSYKLSFTSLDSKYLFPKYFQPSGVSVVANAKLLIAELQKMNLKPVSYEEAKKQWQQIQD